MTDRDSGTDLQLDHPIEELVTRALADSAQLIPTTAVEVARAEAAGVELGDPLPARLQEYQSEPARVARVVALDSVRDLAQQRRVWLGHGMAAIVGAAAALGLVWGQRAQVPRTQPSIEQDPQRLSIGAGNVNPSELAPVTVKLDDTCSPQCCAGVDCKTTTDKPKECASQRRCVRCMESDASGERYRIRTGRIAPNQALVRLLAATPDKVLELCFRVNAVTSGDFACTVAQARGDLDAAWASLPIVASGADLLSGLAVQLRWRGEAAPIGEWSSPIQSNTAVLCNGLSIKPKQPDGELLGTLSVFLDDTYYVELGRSREPTSLTKLTRVFRFQGTTPKLFETGSEGENRFAATLGPLGKVAAEQIRWALLQGGGQAQVVVGADYRGEPLLVK